MWVLIMGEGGGAERLELVVEVDGMVVELDWVAGVVCVWLG